MTDTLINHPVIDGMQWSPAKVVNTRNGARQVKTAPPSPEFWDLWKSHKDDLRESGFSISKFGDWMVNWWCNNEGLFMYPSLDPLEPVAIEDPAEDAYGEPVVLAPLVNESNLKPWQPQLVKIRVAAMKAWNANLDACGTGVGKTFTTLGTIRERGQKALVVCPKNIVIDWIRAAHLMGVEIEAHGWEWIKTGKTRFGHWEMIPAKKKGGRAKKGNFIWTVPDGWDVVFDEAHRASGMDTQNSHIVVQAKEKDIPIHALSATLANDPTKMRAVGQVLQLHHGGRSFFEWMARHGVREHMLPVAGRKIKLYKFEGKAADLQRIHSTIFPSRGCRVTAESLGAVFPPNTTIAKSYNMEEEKEIREAYMEMQAKVAEIEMMRDMRASEKQACVLVAILRARQRVELLKVPLLVSLTRDALEEGNSIFIAVNFKETIIQLKKELPDAAIIAGLGTGQEITGEKYNEHTRRNAIDDFQANRKRVIIGIIQACREGLNLQDIHGGHPRVSYILPTPSAFDLRQVLGRIWRSTGVTPSQQNIVFAANTIEEEVCENLATKLDQLDLLMDGHLAMSVFPEGYSEMREETEE